MQKQGHNTAFAAILVRKQLAPVKSVNECFVAMECGMGGKNHLRESVATKVEEL
jgi:hypothetical protein